MPKSRQPLWRASTIDLDTVSPQPEVDPTWPVLRCSKVTTAEAGAKYPGWTNMFKSEIENPCELYWSMSFKVNQSFLVKHAILLQQQPSQPKKNPHWFLNLQPKEPTAGSSEIYSYSWIMSQQWMILSGQCSWKLGSLATALTFGLGFKWPVAR